MDFEKKYYDLLDDYEAMIESANDKIISKNTLIEDLNKKLCYLQTANNHYSRIIGFNRLVNISDQEDYQDERQLKIQLDLPSGFTDKYECIGKYFTKPSSNYFDKTFSDTNVTIMETKNKNEFQLGVSKVGSDNKGRPYIFIHPCIREKHDFALRATMEVTTDVEYTLPFIITTDINSFIRLYVYHYGQHQ